MSATALNLSEALDLDYDIVVTPDRTTEGDRCYLARHPELPGCMSHGETPEEAVRNLADARSLYLRTLLEDGLDVPLPRSHAA